MGDIPTILSWYKDQHDLCWVFRTKEVLIIDFLLCCAKSRGVQTFRENDVSVELLMVIFSLFLINNYLLVSLANRNQDMSGLVLAVIVLAVR